MTERARILFAMSKYHLYGKDYEVAENEAAVRISSADLISSPADVFLLQSADRKQAFIAFVGVGGETYTLATPAMRAGDELGEHLRAQLILVDAGKR